MSISRLLPYSSDMVYKDRFGVYYVNDSFYKSIKIGSLSLTNITVIITHYPPDMIYKDQFGVYYVNQKMYSGDKKEMFPIIGEIQVPKYDINLNQENQSSNNSIYQCRQLMKKNGKSDAITLSSRFLYSVPPIHFNNSKSWNSYISKARDDANNKPKKENEKVSLVSSFLPTPIDSFIDGPFVHTSIGTFVENVRYNTKRSIIELLIPNAHPSTRNND